MKKEDIKTNEVEEKVIDAVEKTEDVKVEAKQTGVASFSIFANEWDELELKLEVVKIEKEFYQRLEATTDFDKFLKPLYEKKVLTTLDSDAGATMAIDKWGNSFLITNQERLLTAVTKMIEKATEGDEDYKKYRVFLGLFK